jgi:diguanylate cyclase (GGDEF)-like protein
MSSTRSESDRTADERDRTAATRDERAAAHDEASVARDQMADARDDRADARERKTDEFDRDAVLDRAAASRDRRKGASDRTNAAQDREAASADRALSARARAASSIDELTRTYRRDTGVVELERAIRKAKRTSQPLTLAFIDVDNLKGTNDSLGHAAGDRLLRAAADAIRGRLRSYDLVVRFGGDEFVCGLADMTPEAATGRFELVNADLAAGGASVTFGFAELGDDDDLAELIARADEAMYLKRPSRRAVRRRSQRDAGQFERALGDGREQSG